MGFVNVTKTVLEDEYQELINNYNTDSDVKEAVDLFNAECDFRKKLKQIRKAQQITQQTMSQELGVNQQAISRFESDEDTSPSLDKVIAYCNALGYELDLKPKEKIVC